MASLDDSIISDQNLMLLDNVTNYNRASVDYFHHKFDYNNLEMSETWALLLKMRKHKLLRLPSCSSEDDDDYSMYLKRLHHCLWRRWGIDQFHLQNNKLDPLSINWNKETDVTVLYGPSLSKDIEQSQETTTSTVTSHPLDNIQVDNDSIHSDTQLDYSSSYDSYSSSVESQTSSIFDSPSILKTKTSVTATTTTTNSPKKSLKFNCMVHRRDIDQKGKFLESNIIINDMDFQDNDIVNSYTTSLHHNYFGNQHYYDFNSKVEKSTLLFDDDEQDSNDFIQDDNTSDYIISLNDSYSQKQHHNHHHHHHHKHNHTHTHNHVRTAVRN